MSNTKPKRLKIVKSKTQSSRWVRPRYVKVFIDKVVATNKKQMNRQLAELFPAFQQFKVEIRKIPEWVMDWDHISL
jgi:DNA-directed RNA polymerase